MAEFLQDNLRVFVVPVDIMDVPELNIYEQMVYIVLRSFANSREATAFPSYNTIAKLGRMSRRKAIDCVSSLVEKGLLKKEIRLDITKNRRIRNTSNLYTIESPKRVHAVHQGSAQHAPRGVHNMHPDSAQHAPEYNHLTKSLKTKSLNKNNNKHLVPVVDERIDNIKELLKTLNIKVNLSTIKKWRKLEKEETILEVINQTIDRPDIKNIVGYISKILESGFTPPQKTSKHELPDYIVNQLQQKEVSTNIKTTTTIDSNQQKEILNLLFKLGEITKKEYETKLKQLN